MWSSFTRLDRIRTALEYRGLDSTKLDIGRLFKEMARRMPDKELNVFSWFFTMLEPPGCQKTSCEKHANSMDFCNCSDGLVPSKCKIHREYMTKRRKRASKECDKLLDLMKEHFGEGVSVLSQLRILKQPPFEDLYKLNTMFCYTKNWPSTLQSDVWQDLQKRIKKAAAEKGTPE